MVRIVVVFVVVLGSIACQSEPILSRVEPKKVQPVRSKAKVAPAVEAVDYVSLVAEGAQLVDVRTAKAFRTGSLPGALNLPYEELLQRLARLPSHERALVVFGSDAFESAKAVAILQQQGWRLVTDMGTKAAW
jgi:phage shock protein E